MHVVPVIDLMDGCVVQAKLGQRQHYLPIQSKLTTSHLLADIVEAILQVYAFDCFYIADLNAILGRDNQQHIEQILQLMQRHPQLTFWVDAGIATPDGFDFYTRLNYKPVIGTEKLSTLNQYQKITHQATHILSLDHFRQGYQGPAQLQEKALFWPQRIIVMSLTKVGSQSGPDLDLLKNYRYLDMHKTIYSAGGVRNMQDIETLIHHHIDGVLLASALHQRKIEHGQITSLMEKTQ